MVAIASSTLERMTTTVKILDLMDLNMILPPLWNDAAKDNTAFRIFKKLHLAGKETPD
jgi:hypothetical protein